MNEQQKRVKYEKRCKWSSYSTLVSGKAPEYTDLPVSSNQNMWLPDFQRC